MTASKYKVELTEAERERLNSLVRGGTAPARMIKRALALLRTDQGLSDRLIAEGLAVNPITSQWRGRASDFVKKDSRAR